MRSDIRPGTTFRDHELTDQSDRRRRLSEIQGIDPVIVVRSRGTYRPKDRRQLRNVVEHAPNFKVAYTKIVTISSREVVAPTSGHWAER